MMEKVDGDPGRPDFLEKVAIYCNLKDIALVFISEFVPE